mmetsp:Transcript_32893/g.104123  ORF Transcript_32893/g.104123 Transcript_32893/m.104123 type:complete len:207 (+) Transcript_32893:5526-6146(+)
MSTLTREFSTIPSRPRREIPRSRFTRASTTPTAMLWNRRLSCTDPTSSSSSDFPSPAASFIGAIGRTMRCSKPGTSNTSCTSFSLTVTSNGERTIAFARAPSAFNPGMSCAVNTSCCPSSTPLALVPSGGADTGSTRTRSPGAVGGRMEPSSLMTVASACRNGCATGSLEGSGMGFGGERSRAARKYQRSSLRMRWSTPSTSLSCR